MILSGEVVGSTYTLTYSNAPIDNPLKGLTVNLQSVMAAPSPSDVLPHSVYQGYIPLRNTMTASNTFDWTYLENWLNAMVTYDHCQGIPKFYMDYPRGYSETNTDNLGTNCAIPQFLLDGGLLVTNYSDYGNHWSLMPDYSDTNLIQALTNFIAHYGAAYDGDPRIGFVQMGLLGFWGEWHCNAHADWWANTNTQRIVIEAYTNAFHNTKLMIRYAAGTNCDSGGVPEWRNDNLPIGYLDDSFTGTTLGTCGWTMRAEIDLAGIGAVDKWKSQPFGGEVRSELITHTWDDPPYIVTNATYCPTNRPINECITNMHASWIGSWFALSHVMNVPPYYDRTVATAHLLGYELYATSFSANSSGGDPSVTVTLTNTGVAPFYYPWSVVLSAVTNGIAIKNWTNDWDIRTVIPGEGAVGFSQTLTSAPARPFTLLMRVLNPLSGGKQLHFANVEEGNTLTNWLTLGNVLDESIAHITTIRAGSIRTP